jgi:hypothetical protein
LYRNFGEKKILAPSFLSIADFAHNEESNMTQNFKSRLEEFDLTDLLDPEFEEELVDKILTGRHVVILHWYLLHYYKKYIESYETNTK